jgi:hypothetical protein
MPGKPAHRLLTVVWFLLGLAIALVFGEIFTRVLLPQNRDTILDILVPDSVVGYTYEPGAIKQSRGREYDVPFVINSLGLREREIDPKPEGTYRIQLTGNSFSVSHGVAVEQSLARSLERELNASGSPVPVEVVNTANAGYNALNYWKSFERFAPVLDPDAVVVGFVQAQEYRCDYGTTRYLIRDGLVQNRYREGEIPQLPKRSPMFHLRKFLARNSELYILLRNFFYYNETVDKLLRRGDSKGGALNEIRPFLEPTPEIVDEGWKRAFRHLTHLRDETRAAGLSLIVLSIPVRAEINPDYASDLAARAGLDSSDIDLEEPLRRLSEFCEAASIPLLECGPAIAQTHNEEPVFMRYDNHWNPRGVEVGVKDAVRQWRESGLPPFRSER